MNLAGHSSHNCFAQNVKGYVKKVDQVLEVGGGGGVNYKVKLLCPYTCLYRPNSQHEKVMYCIHVMTEFQTLKCCCSEKVGLMWFKFCKVFTC